MAEWAEPRGTSEEGFSNTQNRYCESSYALLTLQARCAADSKRCAGTAAHRLGAGVGAGAGAGCWVLGAGCWVLGAGCWVLGAGC